MEGEKMLSESLFNQIKEDCPEFLNSYFVLLKFYQHITLCFKHSKWKDGRIVLTPIPSEDVKAE